MKFNIITFITILFPYTILNSAWRVPERECSVSQLVCYYVRILESGCFFFKRTTLNYANRCDIIICIYVIYVYVYLLHKKKTDQTEDESSLRYKSRRLSNHP